MEPSNNAALRRYLIVAFGAAWVLQLIACFLAPGLFRPILAVSMFTPLVGALAAMGKGVKSMGWKPGLRRGWPWYLVAWFVPAALTIAGGALYFLVFPAQFDPSLGALRLTLEAAGGLDADGTVQGMSMGQLLLVQAVQAVTWAPAFNALVAVGEEAGWRGFLTPVLQSRLGKRRGLVASGVIWGLWHAPVIMLAGYNYGVGYFGAPVTGALAFCLITTGLGALCTLVYERTGSLWAPSVLHGAFNAIAALPLYLTDGSLTGYLLGPIPVGLVGGLPIILAGVLLLARAKDE